jgi:hypothetical protein
LTGPQGPQGDPGIISVTDSPTIDLTWDSNTQDLTADVIPGSIIPSLLDRAYLTGSGSNTRIAYYTGSNSLGNSQNLYYTANNLFIGGSQSGLIFTDGAYRTNLINIWGGVANAYTYIGTNGASAQDLILDIDVNNTSSFKGFRVKLGGTERLWINNSGQVQLSDLAGSGNRMVIANTDGRLLTQSIPTGTVSSISTNNGITGGTITTSGTIGLTGQALALHNYSSDGIMVRTGANNFISRAITAGTGITVTNGSGISGNPVINCTVVNTDSQEPTRSGTGGTTLGLSGSSTILPNSLVPNTGTTGHVLTKTVSGYAFAAPSGGVSGSGTDREIAFWTGSSPATLTSNSGLHYSTNNRLGIGITAGTRLQLHDSGSFLSTNGLSISHASSSNTFKMLHTGSNNFQLTTGSGFTNAGIHLTNTSTTIGINTTSPTQTLDVNGGARIRGFGGAGVVTADQNGVLATSGIGSYASIYNTGNSLSNTLDGTWRIMTFSSGSDNLGDLTSNASNNLITVNSTGTYEVNFVCSMAIPQGHGNNKNIMQVYPFVNSSQMPAYTGARVTTPNADNDIVQVSNSFIATYNQGDTINLRYRRLVGSATLIDFYVQHLTIKRIR